MENIQAVLTGENMEAQLLVIEEVIVLCGKAKVEYALSELFDQVDLSLSFASGLALLVIQEDDRTNKNYHLYIQLLLRKISHTFTTPDIDAMEVAVDSLYRDRVDQTLKR